MLRLIVKDESGVSARHVIGRGMQLGQHRHAQSGIVSTLGQKSAPVSVSLGG